MDMVVLQFHEQQLQDIQTRDNFSVFVPGTEVSHLSLRGDLLSVTSGWHPQQRG